MDEARSVSYSINVRANTSQAEASIRNVTSGLGNLQGGEINISADSSQADSSIRNVTSNLGGLHSQASSVGSAFRSSFLIGVDGGNTFSSSLRSGVGGAFSYVMGQANAFRENVVSGAQNITNGFAHPISTIRNGLGNAIQSAKDRFTDYTRNAERAASATDDMGGSAGGARQDVSNLGEAAKESGGKFEKLGGALKGAGVAIAAVSAAAAAGTVALGKEVISSFSNYEQLVGGIDTLFGNASKTVQNYAANAFQTSGMAANDYMELATSFSSSLIKSLGGDTAAAAKATDVAITDMADNSNKMGTSLESIQNAYRGFSMQNYTMLDNLKLGYGGTQDEMQRLLDDAGKLAGTKFDISSFSDITKAIHVVQTEMGITGTTAKEAAETISGSWASTTSAVQNLITGLGRTDADLGVLVGNVIQNFGNVVDNVVPVIENMVSSMPAVMDSLIPAIGEMLPKLLGVVETLFGEVLGVLLQLLPELLPVIASAIGTIANTILDNIPLLIEAGITIITSLISGIGEALPEFIPAIVGALTLVVNTLVENMPLLLDAGMQLLMGLAQGIINAIPMLIDQLPIIISSIVEFISGNLPTILETGVNILIQLAAGIIQAIPQLVMQLPQIISAIVNGIGALIESVVEVGKNIVRGIWDGITAMAGWIKDKVTGFFGGIVDGVKDFLGIHSPSRVFASIGNFMATGLGQGFKNTMGRVTKGIANSIPTKFDMPAITGPANAVFKVNPIVGDVAAPVVADSTYSVTPVVSDFDLPDPNTDYGDGDGSHVDIPNPDPVSGGGSPAFAPQINVIVQGSADEESIEKLKTLLRNIFRELYEEFRENEREHMVLKNQYAY